MADLAKCLPDKAGWEDMWRDDIAFLKAKDAHEKAAEAEVCPSHHVLGLLSLAACPAASLPKHRMPTPSTIP